MPSSKKKNDLIVKANKIIEAKYRLSAREQKVLLFFISMLEPSHQRGHVYQTHVNEIMEVLNTNDTKWGDVYTSFKEIVTSLKSKPLHIETDSEIIICNWLGAVSLVKKSGDIKFAFEPQLEPFLFEVKKNFTQYSLQYIVHLRSGYSIRIYELLKQYANLKQRKFDLDTLRSMLGIEEDLYPRYFDFKKRVIDPAKEDLAENTDITFEFDELKSGKKVVGLHFHIYLQNPPKKENMLSDLPQKTTQKDFFDNLVATAVENDNDKKTRLILRLKEFGLEEWQIQKVVEKVGTSASSGIWKTINDIKMAHHDGHIKGTLSGYAANVLDKKYKLGLFEKK
ncbi:MAG: hypothetical protein OHK0057_27320 [Thermoflexibacter sp.]